MLTTIGPSELCVVVNVSSMTMSSLNHLTDGGGEPPLTVQVRVIWSFLLIVCGAVIIGAPGGPEIKLNES